MFQDLTHQINHSLALTLSMGQLLKALQLMSEEFSQGSVFRKKMENILSLHGVPQHEITEGMEGIKEFLKPALLKKKLARELGTENPFALERADFTQEVFEGWAPLGVLVHVTPANAWTVGFLSVIEGLLAGNLNILKLSSTDSEFATECLKRLGELEPTGVLKTRLISAKISSKDKEQMKAMLSHADGVAAWGGEEAIRGLKELTPEGARFIDWGPKISFAYFTEAHTQTHEIEALVREVCDGDQQACSAPQCVYLETESDEVLMSFAKKLAAAFEKLSADIPGRTPDTAETSEITVVTRMQELKRAMNQGDVIKGEGWRILIDPKTSLRPSPLYRSLWLKKIKRSDIITTLRPLRRYLQTAGVAASAQDINDLNRLMTTAGVLRVTPMGSMMGSYEGEPHDGVYALTRYARRISLRGNSEFKSIGRLDELSPKGVTHFSGKIMQKADFQAMEIDSELAPLTFRSGGSSGDPKFSRFTYADYHSQMKLAGFGLMAAGFEPTRDRAMNLFFGGGLYGGFISFFTILESLKATQFPMAALPDHVAVGESIITHKVDVLLGMPSYLVQLFSANDALFKKHRLIKKIFYGGEHFQEAQKEHLIKTYGVELIKSAAYGSVDAGPIGYQCLHTSGSVHHMHTDSHSFEVVELERDVPVKTGEMGRLLVTTHMREGQHIERYDLGDLVKLLPDGCACGRPGLKLELMGRHGDVVRIGASFFNYARLAKILADVAHYAGEMQMILKAPATPAAPEEIIFVMDEKLAPSDEIIGQAIIENEPDFHEAVVIDRVLKWTVKRVSVEAMKRVQGSGKLIHVIDERRS